MVKGKTLTSSYIAIKPRKKRERNEKGGRKCDWHWHKTSQITMISIQLEIFARLRKEFWGIHFLVPLKLQPIILWYLFSAWHLPPVAGNWIRYCHRRCITREKLLGHAKIHNCLYVRIYIFCIIFKLIFVLQFDSFASVLIAARSAFRRRISSWVASINALCFFS